MNLNKKELRIVIYEFNCIGSRLIRSSYGEFLPVLRKFIGHINSTDLINEYVSSCKRENFDMNTQMHEVKNGNGRYTFDLGYTDEEEVYTIYNVLEYIVANGFDLYSIGRAYSSETSYNNIIKDFNSKISLILINHISSFLTKIGIEMGFDEEVSYMITNNGGQVNISKDMSTLNAVQNIGAKSDELVNLVSEINKLLVSSSIPKKDREEIKDSIETVQSELQNSAPKSGLIRTCVKGLEACITGIPNAIELCDNIQQFIDFVISKI